MAHTVLSTALNSDAINVIARLLISGQPSAGLGPRSGQDIRCVAAWDAGLTMLSHWPLAYRDRGLGRIPGIAMSSRDISRSSPRCSSAWRREGSARRSPRFPPSAWQLPVPCC